MRIPYQLLLASLSICVMLSSCDAPISSSPKINPTSWSWAEAFHTAEMAILAGTFDSAWAYYDRIEAKMTAQDSGVFRVRLWIGRSRVCAETHQPDSARTFARRAERLAEQNAQEMLPRARLHRLTLINRGIDSAYASGDYAEAFLKELRETPGETSDSMRAEVHLAQAAYWQNLDATSLAYRTHTDSALALGLRLAEKTSPGLYARAKLLDGDWYWYQGDWDRGHQMYLWTYDWLMERDSQPSWALWNVYNYLGTSIMLRDPSNDSAAWALEQSLQILETLYGPESPELAKELQNLAYYYSSLPDLIRYRHTLQRSLDVMSRIYQDRPHENYQQVLAQYGNSLYYTYDYFGAVQYLSQALEMDIQLHGSYTVMSIRSSVPLASIYKLLGNLDSAYRYLQIAEDLVERYPNAIEVQRKRSLILMIKSHYLTNELQQFEAAERMLQARISELQSLAVPNLEDMIDLHGTLVEDVYMPREAWQKAHVSLNHSIEYGRAFYGEDGVNTWFYRFIRGIIFERQGKLRLAEASFREALAQASIHESNIQNSTHFTLQIDASIGLAKSILRRPDAPQELVDEAFAQLIGLPERLVSARRRAGPPSSRNNFFEAYLSRYEEILWHISQRRSMMPDSLRDRLPWAYLQTQKALSLLDQEQTLTAQQLGGIPPAVVELESNLTDMVYLLQYQVSQMQDAKQRRNAQSQLDRAIRRRDSLLQDMQMRFPNYYEQQHQTKVATLSDVRTDLLDDSTLLIEYFMGDTGLYLMAVAPDTAWLIHQRVDSSWRAELNEFIQLVKDEEAAIRASDAAEAQTYARLAHRWYQRLLAPVFDSLQRHPTNLVIVPDGALNYIPFEALTTRPAPNAKRFRDLPYAVHEHVIRYAYSSTLAVRDAQQHQQNGRRYGGYAPRYDSLSAKTMGASGHCTGEQERYLTPWSVIDAVKATASQLGGQAITDLAASEAAFKEQAAEYGILQVGAHAFACDDNPLSSGIVFSEWDQPRSLDATEDGYLHAHEIFGLSLPSELVVLTACHTGAGQLQRGEGVMSLARAFRYAGSRNLINSLWSADAMSAAELSERFFDRLSKQDGKAYALQQAKRDNLADASSIYTHPYYWANLVLIGDNTPIQIASKWAWWIGIGVGACLLLIVGLALYWRRRQMRSV